MRLELRGVTKRFGEHVALSEVSCTLEVAGALVLIGPSGGGKSTLLRILGGLERPDAGEVVVNGRALSQDQAELRAYRRTVGTVFQAFNLFPHLSALENITLPLERVHGLAPQEARQVAEEALRRFELLSHAHKRPGELSGGQRQRVAIARAVSIKPDMLLLDEPTSALDPEMTAEVLEMIVQLRQEGRDLILVTHQMGFARHVADHAIFLAGGTVVESRSGAELFTSPHDRGTSKFLSRVLAF